MATPTEASERLDIPPATLRRYVSLFGEHLSEEARLPRGRQFGESDLAILTQIRTLLASGSSVEEVQAALGGSPLPPAERRPIAAPPAARDDVHESESSFAAAVVPEAGPSADEPEPIDDISEGADVEDSAAAADEEESWPRWRSFARVQPVRTSREVRKMAAEMGVTDHLSQRLALAEDRIMTYNERMAVLEARIARLEEWVKTPWYRRIFSRPPEYDL